MKLIIDVYVKDKSIDKYNCEIIEETLDEFEILQIMQNKINDRTDKYLVDKITIISIEPQ